MALRVLPLVQDADHVQVIHSVEKVDHVRAAHVFFEIWQDLNRTPLFVTRCQTFESCYEAIVVGVCLRHRSVFERVEPDVFKVSCGQWGQAIGPNHAVRASASKMLRYRTVVVHHC